MYFSIEDLWKVHAIRIISSCQQRSSLYPFSFSRSSLIVDLCTASCWCVSSHDSTESLLTSWCSRKSTISTVLRFCTCQLLHAKRSILLRITRALSCSLIQSLPWQPSPSSVLCRRCTSTPSRLFCCLGFQLQLHARRGFATHHAAVVAVAVVGLCFGVWRVRGERRRKRRRRHARKERGWEKERRNLFLCVLLFFRVFFLLLLLGSG